MPIAEGVLLGPYRIVAQLGAGGMGEVYRAHDPRLNREVAVKVLRADRLISDESRQRFIQEARAASALNHPNIVTVHDIGTNDGNVYLVMELLEGRGLDHLIPNTGMPVPQLLAIAIQVASACAKAHAAGIVHRDLKPSNIMVVAEGPAKVLDFGLAKLMEAAVGDDTKTVTAQIPDNTVMGTAAYMSPEQAEGKAVDARSDIFSFGSMLYEMASGKRPFRADTYMSTIAAVIRDTPKPLAELRPELPAELVRLIERCLRKDPARRAQSMADLKVLLEDLKEDSDEGKLTSTVAPSPVTLPMPAPAAGRRPGIWIASAAALFALAAVFFWRSQRGAPATDAALQPIPLTSFAGAEADPSFSPDGGQLAFTWNGERQDNDDIYVKVIGAGTPLRLTTDPKDDRNAQWAPDGRSIAFLRFQSPTDISLMVTPPLGGQERKIAQLYSNFGIGSFASLCWTPDSRHLIFSGSQTPGMPNSLLLVSVDSGEVKTLIPWEGAGLGFQYPEVAPDGQQLVAIGQGESRKIHIWPFDAKNQVGPVRILDSGSGGVFKAVWAPDSRDLIFSLNVNMPLPLYRISAGGGEPRALTWTGSGAVRPAISARGHRLAFSNDRRDTNMWQVSLESPPRAEPHVIAASSFRDVAPDYSPDGKRLVFYSNQGGKIELWVANADGTGAAPLTSLNPQATTATPRWSPDGKRISFDSDATGSYQVYVIGADGGQPRALTTGPSASFVACWSKDGAWVYFTSNRSGRNEIWRAPSNGGELQQVTKTGAQSPLVSPDGKWLYFTKNDIDPQLWRRPIDAGEETQITDSVYRYNYAVTADGVYWVPRPNADGSSSVRYLDLATRASREIAKVAKPVDIGLAVSPDAKTLLFTQRDYTGLDLMLVEGFR